MKKKALLLSLMLIFALCGTVYAAGGWNGFATVKVTSGGKTILATDPTIVVKGKTFVSTSMLKKMGLTVSGDTKSIKVDLPKPPAAVDPVTLTNEIINNNGVGVTILKESGVMTAETYLPQIKDYDNDWYYFDQIFQRLAKFNVQMIKIVYADAQGNEIGTVSVDTKTYRDHMDGKVTDQVLQSKWIVTGKIGRVPLTPKEIGKLQNAVGVVLTYDANGIPLAQGSGFVVNEYLFLTNHHVIDGSARTEIKVDGVTYDASKWYYFDNKDTDLFAVLLSTSYDATGQVSGSAPAHSLNFSTDLPEIGDKVYAIGSPKGLENSLSEGIVSSIRTENGITYIQHTADIDHGSSGGVLLNEYGEVIGVTSAGVEGSNLEFAIPMKYVQQELDKLKK